MVNILHQLLGKNNKIHILFCEKEVILNVLVAVALLVFISISIVFMDGAPILWTFYCQINE